jgi:rhamnosyltransferase
MKISIIIPTLNAADSLPALLQALRHQSLLPHEILIVDSQSSDATETIARQDERVVFIPIDRKDFDHGGTRDRAFRRSTGDFVLFFTQDALPADTHYIENILRPFVDEQVAMVGGRQLPRPGASLVEQLTQLFNYPAESHIRSLGDIKRRGIKTFFVSDVCSAYRRTAYFAIGGFEHPLRTNEDMLIAARFIYGGYKVAYCAEAQVVHSHPFVLTKSFVRNFHIGAFMSKYAAVFAHTPAFGEGKRLVCSVLGALLKQGRIGTAIAFCFESAVKGVAYQIGYFSQKFR